ncbi:hypothetical protein ACVI1L_000001, partial [Bradyrhizobium sp. USDA 4516]
RKMMEAKFMTEPAGFEPGPVDPAPISFGFHGQPAFDPLDLLPPGAADRLRQFRQHVQDRHALTVPFQEISEANTAKLEEANRHRRLTDHQQHGGFNLKADDPRVVAAQSRLDKLTDDHQRLVARNEMRSQEWREAAQTLAAVEAWLGDGRPQGTLLKDFKGPEPKLVAGEDILSALDKARRRGRELRADVNRIRSASFPLSYCKQRIREQVAARKRAPDVSPLIEHDGEVVWPTMQVQVNVYNAQPGAVGFAEVPDTLGSDLWKNEDAWIAAFDRELASEADDKAALSPAERQKREAEVLSDLLAVERDESALVWRAMGEQLPVTHRADCSPLAILQCELVTAPRGSGSPGTTPGLSFDLLIPGAR